MRCPKCGEDVDFIADVQNGKMVYFCPNCALTLQEQIYSKILEKYNNGEDYRSDDKDEKIDTTTQTTNTVPVEVNTVNKPRVYTTTTNTRSYGNSASLNGAGVGFGIVFFLGIGGLILCNCLGDDDCKKGAWITFWIAFTIKSIMFFLYLLPIIKVLIQIIK